MKKFLLLIFVLFFNYNSFAKSDEEIKQLFDLTCIELQNLVVPSLKSDYLIDTISILKAVKLKNSVTIDNFDSTLNSIIVEYKNIDKKHFKSTVNIKQLYLEVELISIRAI